jgi:quercetin dioxygenase-like cupin family protein
MFSKAGKYPYHEILEGVRLRALAHGNATQMVEFLLEADRALPLHDHPYEQTGYLIRGAMELQIGDDYYQVGPGDSWTIPSGVPHAARVSEETLVIELFSPVRADYLPEVLHPADDG